MKKIVKIVIATHNKDKSKEILEGCRELSVEFLTLDKFSEIGDIDETGNTLEENAFIKARTVHSITGFPVIADDTGLEVDALDGAPGIYSARYAGKNCSYRDNVEKMLQSMQNIPDNLRSAQFKTVMVYVDKNVELVTEGIVKGTITKDVLVNNGMAYKNDYIKILGRGKLTSKIDIIVDSFSDSAKRSIEKLGGTITQIK